MKSFLKIGLLFALIITGRYMQLTTPAATAGLAKSPILLFVSDTTTTMTLAHYADEPSATVTPVSQQRAEQPTTWF